MRLVAVQPKWLVGLGVAAVALVVFGLVGLRLWRSPSSVKLSAVKLGPGFSVPIQPRASILVTDSLEFHIAIGTTSFVYLFDEHHGVLKKLWGPAAGELAWEPGEYASDPPENETGYKFNTSGPHRFVALATKKLLPQDKKHDSLQRLLDEECVGCAFGELIVEVAPTPSWYGN